MNTDRHGFSCKDEASRGRRIIGDTLVGAPLELFEPAQKHCVRASYASFEIINRSSRGLKTRPLGKRKGGLASNGRIRVRRAFNQSLNCFRSYCVAMQIQDSANLPDSLFPVWVVWIPKRQKQMRKPCCSHPAQCLQAPGCHNIRLGMAKAQEVGT